MISKNKSMCIFCSIVRQNKYIYENEHVVAFYDNYPVSLGHVIIISKRHVGNVFEYTTEEIAATITCIGHIKKTLDTLYNPDGYNIGTNVDIAAGQTIMHAHIHMIPRYKDDMHDPRGGVRGVIPEKQKY